MTEEELILALCREADPDATETDEEQIAIFRENHHPELIAKAADQDIPSLIELRLACGLLPFG